MKNKMGRACGLVDKTTWQFTQYSLREGRMEVRKAVGSVFLFQNVFSCITFGKFLTSKSPLFHLLKGDDNGTSLRKSNNELAHCLAHSKSQQMAASHYFCLWVIGGKCESEKRKHLN